MEFRQLEAFRAVAHEKSFTRAAAITHYTQSSVSAQIKALEESLGVALFDRLGREVSLTAAGRDFSRYAEQLLDLAAEAREVVTGVDEPSGLFKLSAPESLCSYRLPGVLDRFVGEHPQVQVLILQEHDMAALEGRIETGDIDLVFQIAARCTAVSLIVEELVAEEVVLVAKPGHPLATKRAMKTAQLQEQTIIFTDSDPTPCYGTIFRQILREEGVFPSNYLEFHSIEAIKKCTMSGVGISLLPRMAVAKELEREELVVLPWRDRRLRISTQMIWHKDKWISPAMRAFMQMAREEIGGAARLR